jgi:hypothetical protein
VREQHHQLDRQPAEPDRDRLRPAQRHSAAADAQRDHGSAGRAGHRFGGARHLLRHQPDLAVGPAGRRCAGRPDRADRPLGPPPLGGRGRLRSRLVDAYAKGSALHDAISVAAAPGGLTSADAAARWAGIQQRADDLAQTLYALREQVPPDSADRARIDDTLASLQAVRSAMDAERVPGGAGYEQAEVVRSRLASFESSLHALGAAGRE